jgi:hypothetical protein
MGPACLGCPPRRAARWGSHPQRAGSTSLGEGRPVVRRSILNPACPTLVSPLPSHIDCCQPCTARTLPLTRHALTQSLTDAQCSSLPAEGHAQHAVGSQFDHWSNAGYTGQTHPQASCACTQQQTHKLWHPRKACICPIGETPRKLRELRSHATSQGQHTSTL